MRQGNIAKGIIVAITAIAPVFSPLPQHPDYLNPAPWGFSMLMIGIGIFSVVFFDSMPQSRNSWLPNWWGSIQFTGFAGLCLLAYATSTAIIGLTHTPKNWFFEIPLFISVGMLITVAFMRTNSPIDGRDD